MKITKQKYYVVWKGRKPGVYDNWNDCANQIKGFTDAVYKSFKSKELAVEAFNSDSKLYIGAKIVESELSEAELNLIGEPIKESISVDGSWNTSTGIVEYQGVETGSGKVLFKVGPFEDGTNNIVEFLGIVHALAYCKQNNLSLPIYSDSKTAMKWVRIKEVKTKHQPSEKNKKLFILLERATKWLNENTYKNAILKWETKAWGENPADFGRK